MSALPLYAQLINLFAALLLLLSFAMLAQRRMLSLINLFAMQGLALCRVDVVVAWGTGQPHLYWSAGADARAQGRCCCRGSSTG